MAHTQVKQSVAIEDVLQTATESPLQKLLANQAFWVTIAVFIIAVVMSIISDPFTSANNLFNVFRNLSFIGIVALGMTAVIITAGIDLSVGSIMGLSGIIAGLVLQAGYPALVGIGAGLVTGVIIGLINGVLIAYLKLSPFVVTLGMLRVRPETLCRITEFSEHESNGRELDEGERVAVEVLPVLGQSAAAVEPGDGAFDHPTPGLDDEALHPIGSLDDLGLEIGQDAGQGAVKDRALVGWLGAANKCARKAPQSELQGYRRRARDRRREFERRWRAPMPCSGDPCGVDRGHAASCP